jgi:hypothetical protein
MQNKLTPGDHQERYHKAPLNSSSLWSSCRQLEVNVCMYPEDPSFLEDYIAHGIKYQEASRVEQCFEKGTTK